MTHGSLRQLAASTSFFVLLLCACPEDPMFVPGPDAGLALDAGVDGGADDAGAIADAGVDGGADDAGAIPDAGPCEAATCPADWHVLFPYDLTPVVSVAATDAGFVVFGSDRTLDYRLRRFDRELNLVANDPLPSPAGRLAPGAFAMDAVNITFGYSAEGKALHVVLDHNGVPRAESDGGMLQHLVLYSDAGVGQFATVSSADGSKLFSVVPIGSLPDTTALHGVVTDPAGSVLAGPVPLMQVAEQSAAIFVASLVPTQDGSGGRAARMEGGARAAFTGDRRARADILRKSVRSE